MEDKIKQILEDAKNNILNNLKNNGKYVSGKSASLFEVIGTDLYGPAWFDTLENGRAAGKVPYAFKDILLKWAGSKGLTFQSTADANRWAFLTSKKIREEGTKQYREGQYLDIYSSILDATVEKVKEAIGDAFREEMLNTFYN